MLDVWEHASLTILVCMHLTAPVHGDPSHLLHQLHERDAENHRLRAQLAAAGLGPGSRPGAPPSAADLQRQLADYKRQLMHAQQEVRSDTGISTASNCAETNTTRTQAPQSSWARCALCRSRRLSAGRRTRASDCRLRCQQRSMQSVNCWPSKTALYRCRPKLTGSYNRLWEAAFMS